MTEQEKTSHQDSTQEQVAPKSQTKQLVIFAIILCFLVVWGVQNPRPALRIVAVLLGFGGIIMIHEFGHFVAAKLGGIKVEAFSIGMGPVVLGIRKLKEGWRFRVLPKIGEEQHVEEGDNETEYQIAMLPIGGYIRMLGQSDTGAASENDDPRSYNNRPVGVRICVVSAGVIFNAIGAMVLFMALYMNGIDLPAGVVGRVIKNSPAYDAGIKAGDKIVEVNGDYFTVDGERCVDFETIFQAALLSSGEPVSYVVRHQDGTEEEIKVIPEKPAGSGKKLRFSGIEKPHKPVIDPVIAKNPDAVDDLWEKTGQGLRPGDEVKAVDGQAVTDPWHYRELVLQTFKPEVKLRISRQWPIDPDSDQRTMESVKFAMLVSPTFEDFRNEYDLTHFCSLVPRLTVAHDGKIPEAEKTKRQKVVEWIRQTVFRQEKSVLPLETGDIIIRVAEVDYPNYQQLRELTNEYEDKDMPVTVLRKDEQGLDQKVELILNPRKRPGSKRVTVGFSPGLDMEHPVVAQVIPDSGHAMLLSEIPAGATIVAVDGESVSNFFEIATLLQKSAGHKVSIEYMFEGKPGGTAVVVPEFEPVHAEASLELVLPFAEMTRLFEASNPVQAVKMGVKKVSQFIMSNYATLGQLFRRDGVEVSDLSGPVGIISMTYQVTDYSVSRYLYFLGLISSCLAVMNLLPLPVLDGGHIVLLIIEKITGKPVHDKILVPIMYIGLALLLGLVLVVTYYDLIRIFFGH